MSKRHVMFTLTLVIYPTINEDSVRIYPLCANCESEIRVIGKGKVSKNKDVYII